ncbi:MAG: hypothetical protein EAZ70_08855 [Runella slithyformis]|nr:MAG: hypothetical protein EAY79_09760 [Runella slithyformis]TAF01105.1 MAG: hypothetical protein EAZ80_03120 [Runella slithyformis]TAF26284.1 MAG: hypothetical protein EAZ70_08855 [Runella slithyformis]TAF44949.1 MAG: hypothetical protein EAZ63_11735 [Runella slithyformis]TAF79524.1 MAG: hypothetical protein EAZ50_11160 [Runella slithyformis]
MNLTTTGKIAVALLVVALFSTAYYFLAPKAGTADTSVSGTLPADEGTTQPAAESATLPADASATAPVAAFAYEAPVPVNGTLKGVVELGAKGFNSFVVNIDKQKNWKLESAEFGNSMVLENMATDYDIRTGLKKYISDMIDHGVSGKNIHFVVSSGALKADITQKIIDVLKSMNYFVNTVTPAQEGELALKCVLPAKFADTGFVVDIGSGNTKVSWTAGKMIEGFEAYGSKYFEKSVADEVVYNETKAQSKQVPIAKRTTCFIIGGVPFELATEARKGKERYTVLKAPGAYKLEKARSKAGQNIYKAIADGTGCQQFVFDWDANFTIGFLLGL